MAVITIPNVFAGGGAAVATEVNANFTAITAQVNGNLDSTNIGAGAIVNSLIAANAITNTKISNNAVTETKISDGSITTAKIFAGAVTNTKIGAGAVRQASMDYSNANSGALVWQAGPSYQTNGVRLARISNVITFSTASGTNLQQFAIDMTNTDNCPDGLPAFASTPMGVVSLRDPSVATDLPTFYCIATINTNYMYVNVYFAAAHASHTAELHGIVMGAI